MHSPVLCQRPNNQQYFSFAGQKTLRGQILLAKLLICFLSFRVQTTNKYIPPGPTTILPLFCEIFLLECWPIPTHLFPSWRFENIFQHLLVMERISFKGVEIIWSLCWTNNLSRENIAFLQKYLPNADKRENALIKGKGQFSGKRKK